MDGTGMSRRRFVKYAGGGGALILAGAAGFIDYRAITQGVFDTEKGPAYTAWDEWDAGEGPMRLVAAAVLAANAHDSQPWLFGVSDAALEVHADRERNLGAVDPLLRELYVSLGCAVENAALAAGYEAKVTLMPERGNETLAARLELTSQQASSPGPLYSAIPDRHTDRGKYESRDVPSDLLDRGSALNDVSEIDVVWLSTEPAKKAFGDLTIHATKAFIADPAQAEDDYRWFRRSWSEIQDKKDGITTDAAGLPPLMRALAKIAPAQSRSKTDDAWLNATEDTQVATAAAYGVIVARDREDRVQQLETGRLYQRLHLWATTQGLGMQPLCQTVERIDREQAAGQSPEITDGMAKLIPAGRGAVMPFRIGYSDNDTLESPRRPAEDVVIGEQTA
jgi:hypothetical protein